MKKRKNIIILLLGLFAFGIFITKVHARQGCCSYHGGQNYCDSKTGKWVCKDGTYSPTCTCSSYNLSDNSSSNCYSENNRIQELEEEKEKLQKQNDRLKTYLTITIIALISYKIYKARK